MGGPIMTEGCASITAYSEVILPDESRTVLSCMSATLPGSLVVGSYISNDYRDRLRSHDG
jgi:hypothetical protein